jgi:hypothetical protein
MLRRIYPEDPHDAEPWSVHEGRPTHLPTYDGRTENKIKTVSFLMGFSLLTERL